VRILWDVFYYFCIFPWFYWANGFGAHGFELAHGFVLYLRRSFTYKRKTPPPFQIVGD
jgi:hypothetical protein